MPDGVAVRAARAAADRLSEQYRTSGDPGLLRRAADQYAAAARSALDADPRKAWDLSQVAAVLEILHDHSGELWTLDQAAAAARSSLALDRDPEQRISTATVLGSVLCTRFEETGEAAVLAEAVRVLTEAAARVPATFSRRQTTFMYAAIALSLSYHESHSVDQLVEAVRLGRRATADSDTLQITALIRLTRDLTALSRIREDDLSLLREAERTVRRAVEISEPGEPKAAALTELGMALERIGIRTGNVNVLHDADQTLWEALEQSQDVSQARLRRMQQTMIQDRLRKMLGPQQHGLPLPPP